MHADALPLPSAAPSLGRRGQRLIGAALGLSLAAHLAALGLLPDWRRAAPPEPPPLRVTLLPPPQPAAAPAPVATVAPPQPPPAVVAAPAVPAAKPQPALPRPVVVARQAPAPKAPRAAPAPVPAASAPTAAEAPATPAPAAPAPPPPAALHAAMSPAAPGIPAEVAPALLARYGQALSELLAQQQKYPRLAATRGWEGEVVLKLVIARKGQLVGAQVIRSSGHAVLDESALALATAAQPFPPVPGPSGGDLEVTVPVHYQLRKG